MGPIHGSRLVWVWQQNVSINLKHSKCNGFFLVSSFCTNVRWPQRKKCTGIWRDINVCVLGRPECNANTKHTAFLRKRLVHKLLVFCCYCHCCLHMKPDWIKQDPACPLESSEGILGNEGCLRLMVETNETCDGKWMQQKSSVCSPTEDHVLMIQNERVSEDGIFLQPCTSCLFLFWPQFTKRRSTSSLHELWVCDKSWGHNNIERSLSRGSRQHLPSFNSLKPATKLALSPRCSSFCLSVDCGSDCTTKLRFQKACGLLKAERQQPPPSSSEKTARATVMLPCNYRSCFFLIR